MIIDSPIISGSYAASGSLNQLGNVVISGSLTVTGSIIGTASFASTASYLSGYVSPFPFTGSAIISGSLDVTGSLKVTDSITSTGTITAQTLVVQTVSSSVIYSSGSNVFGNDLANTQVLTGSVTITGSLAVNGSNAILTNQTSSMSASYAVSASYALNSTSASFATTSSFSLNVPVTASFANTATSASYSLTSSFSLNVPVTASFANNATSASFATTASYLTGYISPFPYTGSAIISGSLEVTGSAAVSNLQGTGVRYLVADASGSITAQTASAAIKQTQAFTSSANQTSFTIDNGYTTGLVDVFINGTKLAPGVEFTDTTGTVITLATGSNSGDLVEFVKYFPVSGVTNNALRQQTTFTASAGQTVFSASYTPGLLDIFYNGSRLSNNEYTANNGTFFTLATGSVAGDILDVFVYSYQVGAFSGIGGVGTAAQVAYFDTTNSITGSPNFTISGSTMTVTGSLIVSGSGTFTNIGPAVFSGSLTSTAGFTGSFSGTATSASFAANAELLDGLDSSVFTLTSSFAAQTASFTAFTSSILSYTASQNILNGTYATTGSNTFAGIQTVNSNLIVTGSITAQTLVVQTITSSVDFVTGSTRFGSILGNTHVFSGSVTMNPGGLFVSSSGNVGIGTISVTEGKLQVNGTIAAMNAGADGTLGTVMKFGNPSYPGTQHHRIRASTSAATTSNLLIFETSTATIDVFNTNQLVLRGDGSVGIGTTSLITSFNVVGSSDSLGRVARFTNSLNSASIDIAHSTNGGVIGYANIGSGNLSNVFYVSTGTGTVGSGIVMNNAGHVGFATSNVTESVQATGTISIIPNSSVSSGPLIQFAGNGRIRPASAGDRLSIDGNSLFLNSAIGGNIITNTAGGGFSIGRSDVPSAFNVSGSTNGSIPVIDIKASGAGSFLRGVRMLNNTMTAGSSLMYAVGYADNSRNMGQFYLYFAGDGSVSNRLSMGLHSVDDVFNIFGSGNVVIGQISDPGYKLAVNGQPGANGYTAWTNYSDLRLKENITDLETTNILNKICAIRPVTFNYNELSGYDEETRSRRISGFIAQELMEKFPDMVGTIIKNEVEYYDTNLSNLNLYLVKAIQEQQTLITALEEKLERNNII
jgi:hypothetical protein